MRLDLRKQPTPFFPIFLAIFPVLAIYSANAGLFHLNNLWRPLLFAAGTSIVIWIGCWLFFRSAEKGARMAAITISACWALKFVHNSTFFWIGVALALVLGCFFARWKGFSVTTLNRFSFILVVVASLRIGLGLVVGSAPSASVSGVATNAARPDVFLIVVDGHGRSDQIKRVLGTDNTAALARLESLGMTVSKNSVSNYCQTGLSVGSVLGMAPIQEQNSKSQQGYELVNRPRLVKALRQNGYSNIAIGTGFPAFTFEGFDLVYELDQSISLFESVILDGFPISEHEIQQSLFDQRAQELEFGFSSIREVSAPTSQPRFVFAHILAPHPPFVFDEHGNRVSRKGGLFSLFDGSDFVTDSKAKERYIKGFAGQLHWVDRELEKVIASIRSKNERSVIIVMGDHGSKAGLDQNKIEATDLEEAFPILFAYSLPPGMAKPTGRTPLEMLAPVFDQILGKGFSKVSGKSWYSPKDRPTDFVEVTDRVK